MPPATASAAAARLMLVRAPFIYELELVPSRMVGKLGGVAAVLLSTCAAGLNVPFFSAYSPGLGSELVSTTSRFLPLTFLIVSRSSFLQRRSGGPLMNQSPPLSASSIP